MMTQMRSRFIDHPVLGSVVGNFSSCWGNRGDLHSDSNQR